MTKNHGNLILASVIVTGVLAISIHWTDHAKRDHTNHLSENQHESVSSDFSHTSNQKDTSKSSDTVKSRIVGSAPTNLLQNETLDQSKTKQTATENFHRLRQCHSSAAKIRNLKDRMNACALAAQHEGGFDEVCKRQMKELDAKIRVENANLVNCDAVPAQVEMDYYASVVSAAKLGDADAQICYIRGNFDEVNGFTKEEIEQYKQTAQDYVNQGIARGDWRVVALLGMTENNLAHSGGLISNLAIGDPITTYKMNRLLLLGSKGDYADILGIRSKTYALRLSPEQIAQADEWAKAYYDRYFASEPKLASPPEPCVDAP